MLRLKIRNLRFFSAKVESDGSFQELRLNEDEKEKALQKIKETEASYLAPRSLRGKLRLALHRISEKTYLKTVPPFSEFGESEVNQYTYFNSFVDIEPSSLWTPLVQLIYPSEELLEKIEFLHYEYENSKTRNFKNTKEVIEFHKTQMYNLTRELIAEAIEGTGYDFKEDFYCNPDQKCQLHGNIPFTIWDRENEHINYGFPLVFVMHQNLEYNSFLKTIGYRDTQLGVAGAAQWAMNRLGNLIKSDKSFADRVKKDPSLQNFKVLLTNGHNWRMYEFHLDYDSRATHIYRPRTAKEVFLENGEKPLFKIKGDENERRIWNDFRQIEIALGVIRYAINKPTKAEEELRKSYSYLKELETGDQLTPEEEKVIKKRVSRSKYLPKFLRRLYVGSGFYLEELEREKQEEAQRLESRKSNLHLEEDRKDK